MKDLLSTPPAAAAIQTRIKALLRAMKNDHPRDCLHPGFTRSWTAVLDLYDRFQQEVIAASGYAVSCRSGCSACCFHWVDDVYPFEAAILAAHLRTFPESRLAAITDLCQKSLSAIGQLEGIMEDKLSRQEFSDYVEEFDRHEIILRSFYQLEIPCPLLGDDGRCCVYQLRPFTCRAYLNLGESAECAPERINDEGDPVTYLLDLDEESNDLLDFLAKRYERFPGETELRPLLLLHIESGE